MNGDSERRPEIEEMLGDLELPGSHAGLRDEIRRGLSPFRLGSPLPWAAAAALLVGLFVTTEVQESAHEEHKAALRGTVEASEPALHWASVVRLLRQRGASDG